MCIPDRLVWGAQLVVRGPSKAPDATVEPVDHLVSQAPCHTIRPPTGTQQIVSLPYFDIHMQPPSQPRIQYYPKILD